LLFLPNVPDHDTDQDNRDNTYNDAYASRDELENSA